MNTVLIYTSPARGHLYPIMSTALELKRRGHRVIIQSLVAEKEHIVAAGFEYVPIAAKIEMLTLDDFVGGSPVNQFKIALECWLSRAPHEIDDLKASVLAYQPDILITDANTWGASAYAQTSGLRWAMFMPFCMPLPSPDAPAFGPGLPPPYNWVGRMRDRFIRGVMSLAIKSQIDQLDVLRKSLGAPPLGDYENLFLQPEVLLYLTAEPFEYARRHWPSNVHAVGPGLWAPHSEAPDWVDELPHPRVLVSVSTEFQQDGAIISTALEALKSEELSVIVTSAALNPEDFERPNEQVRITRFLPHDSVIPKVDLVITHGGMGTTQRALANGVPVCVIPWGRDQNETARRVEVCGAGVRLSRAKLSPERLLEAATKALKCKPGASQVAAGFEIAGGAIRAANLVENMTNAKLDIVTSLANSKGKAIEVPL